MPGHDTNADGSMAAMVALASLPLMGPRRLGQLVAGHGAVEAWARLQSGRDVECAAPSAAVEQWRLAARAMDPEAVLSAHHRAGVVPCVAGQPDWPTRLTGDPEPPVVLFQSGNPQVLAAPTVGIVGTRRCTRYGRDVAFELGAALADAGVVVVSGLALGIDAAAHAGALEAGGVPVGVVASGLDQVYPRPNRGLWKQVIDQGLLVTEHALGVSVARWAFPARNRIIAGLADVVVVVESATKGGSLYTVDAALERDRPVFAVPGPIRSEVSKGTNQLLVDGAFPMTRPADVLAALDLESRTAEVGVSGVDDSVEDPVLAALGWEPATVDELASRTGRPAALIGGELQLLVAQGQVVQQGAWFERTVARSSGGPRRAKEKS